MLFTLSGLWLQAGTRRCRRLVLVSSALGVLLASGGFYWQNSLAAPGARDSADKPAEGGRGKGAIPAVEVATVRQTDFEIYLSGLGMVTALHTVTVKPQVDGELVAVNFKEGQEVKAGDILARIDPRPFQARLRQAEGQLLRDQALLRNAEIDQTRYQTLLDQDSIAPQQVENQAAQVKQYLGLVEMDRAQVESAKLQLSYATIKAPISGRAGLRLVDAGNLVRAGDNAGIAVITQSHPVTVVFTLPEDQVQAVLRRYREQPTIAVDAYDRGSTLKLASGRLLAFDNQIDPGTGTFKLKAQFDNLDDALFANQFVNVKMHIDTLRQVATVPSQAMQYDSQGPFVFVVEGTTVRQRRVKTGTSEGEHLAVLEALRAGEKVVVQGFDRLRDGGDVLVAGEMGEATASGTGSKFSENAPQPSGEAVRDKSGSRV